MRNIGEHRAQNNDSGHVGGERLVQKVRHKGRPGARWFGAKQRVHPNILARRYEERCRRPINPTAARFGQLDGGAVELVVVELFGFNRWSRFENVVLNNRLHRTAGRFPCVIPAFKGENKRATGATRERGHPVPSCSPPRITASRLS